MNKKYEVKFKCIKGNLEGLILVEKKYPWCPKINQIINPYGTSLTLKVLEVI